MRITKKLDKLFSEWKQSKTNYTDNFAEDGIVNETLWQNSDPKTLILLKDTNDYSGDLRQLIDRKPWRELGRWSFAMQHTSSSEIADFDRANKSYQEYCRMLAVMNLKKTSGESNAKYSGIEQAALDDKDFIQRELTIINPQVIICGGTFDIFKKLYPDIQLLGNRIYKHNNRTIIDFVHPTQFNIKRDMIFYNLCVIYQKKLKNGS